MSVPQLSRRTSTTILALTMAVTAFGCGEPRGDGVDLARSDESPPAETLYVLDPNGESHTGRIVQVDTGSHRVERSFATGYDPAMAVSPDGSRLFIASAQQNGKGALRDVLTVVDAATGAVMTKTAVEDRWEGVGVTLHPTMATSPDGRLLYVLQGQLTGPDAAAYSVATYDTAAEEFLPATIPLEGCGPGTLLPSLHDAARRLQVVCPISHDVRILEVSPDGAAASSDAVALPTDDDGRTDGNRNPLELWRLSTAVLGSSDQLYAITQNGRIYVIDLIRENLVETVNLELGTDEFIAIGHAEASVGGELFLGRGTLSSSGMIDRLRATAVLIVDIASWEVDGVVSPDAAFESMTASSTGDVVFTIDNDNRAVSVIDARDRRHAAVIRQVGQTPTLAEVAPHPSS